LGVSLNRLDEIILGKPGVTADTALRVARLLKMSPQSWVRLQADWDLHQALAREARNASQDASGRCLFLAFSAPQLAATAGNTRHVPARDKLLTPREIGSFRQPAATAGNTRQNELDPAVNRRVVGSSPT